MAYNRISKEVGDWMRIILKLCDPSVLRDLRVHNEKTGGSLENYGRIAEEKMEELQATAVDERWHGLPTRLSM